MKNVTDDAGDGNKYTTGAHVANVKEAYAANERFFQAWLEAPDAPEIEDDGGCHYGVIGKFKGHDVKAYHNTSAKFFLFDVDGRSTAYTINQRYFQYSGCMAEALADFPEFVEWLAEEIGGPKPVWGERKAKRRARK